MPQAKMIYHIDDITDQNTKGPHSNSRLKRFAKGKNFSKSQEN